MSATYEDVFIYLDLTKDILKKKDVVKAIMAYIKEKNKSNLKGHYGILIFQEEGNPVFITDKKDSKIIAKVIDENWKSRPKKESFFENGLFYIFSFIAETVRKKSKNNRVIVITDTPSDLNDEYQEAVFNLVDKIKYFPTFIDIIRIAGKDDKFFKDDVKLNILASDTKGGIFQVRDKKNFSDTILRLIKQKQLVTTFKDQPDQIKINQDDYAFYSRLAKSLKRKESMDLLACSFCHEEICPVCMDVTDVPMLCEECGSGFHSCCVTNYVINHNIGIPHIFRCPGSECDILLKIDEDEIIEVLGEENITSVKEYIGTELEQEISKETDDTPKIIGVETVSETKQELEKKPQKAKAQESTTSPTQASGEPSKKIQVGGFFGKVYSVKKVGDKLVYEKITKQTTSTYQAEVTVEVPKKAEQLSRPKPKSRKRPKINICPVCGTPLKDKRNQCNNCGYKFT